MNDHGFQNFLKDNLVARCRTNSAYSLRSFAKFLEIEPSFLSKMLNGKRSITQKTIVKIGKKLSLGPNEIKSFMGAQEDSDSTFHNLSLDHFKMISDWYHYAILELTELKSFESDPTWMAKKLGIQKIEVQVAVERLIRLNMLGRNSHGELKNISGRNTTVGSPYTTEAFRKLQKQILLQAVDALEMIPMLERDQSSITMAADSRLIKETKKRIKNFRRELCDFLQTHSKRKDHVYQLAISFFPATKNIQKNLIKEKEK